MSHQGSPIENTDFFDRIGQKRTFGDVGSMSGFPPKADTGARL
jgi:hypothetical protein